MPTPLDGANVTVMGLGRFGGGAGVTRWLCSRDARVLLTDLESEESLAAPLESLRPLIDRGQVALRLGGHNVSDFTTCDLVVSNPAVPRPWDNRFLRAAQAAGIAVTTEVSLMVEHLPAGVRTIAVTGSVGKSTTTAMIHAGLVGVLGEQRVFMGGNIGGSLLEQVSAMRPDAAVVLELSSAMLHWLHETARFAPDVAVLTSFSENHVDWHGSVEHYRASKAHILEHQRVGQAVVLGPGMAGWGALARPGVSVIDVDATAFPAAPTVPGSHNRANAAIALAACLALETGLDAGDLADAIAAFPGLPHRLEFVGEFRGVRYYNDSKCTTPEALRTALEAVAPQSSSRSRVHIIAGGYDKKTDLSSVATLAEGLAGVYTVGQTGGAIAAACSGRKARAVECGTLERAMVEVKQRAASGDVVLLSPACASWDQFVNFEQRGDLFRRLARGEA